MYHSSGFPKGGVKEVILWHVSQEYGSAAKFRILGTTGGKPKSGKNKPGLF